MSNIGPSRDHKRPRNSSARNVADGRNSARQNQNGGIGSHFGQFSSSSPSDDAAAVAAAEPPVLPRSSQPQQQTQQQNRYSKTVEEGKGNSIHNTDSNNDNDNDNNGGRDEETDPYGDADFDLDGAADEMPNDTLAAIMSLQQQFYGKAAVAAATTGGSRGNTSGRARTGLVLHHQIYTVLQNRTAVDLELTAMRKDNTLRTFRLSTGREDWGVMSTEHYLKVISSTLGDATESGDESSATGIESSSSVAHATNTRRRAPGDGAPMPGRRGTSGRNIISGASSSGGERQPPAIDVLKRLIHVNRKAYASRKEVAIAMQEVLDRREMSSQVSGADAAPDSDGERGRGEGAGGKQKQGGEQLEEELDFITIKKEEAKVVSLVSELIRAGFLLPRRDVGREEAYWFSVPQLGKIIAAVSRGRTDIVNMLKRTRFKEIRRSVLESKNPAKTGFPLNFHIRDLVGLGRVREFETPSGAFIRLARDT